MRQSNKLFELKGKRALVTGASRGIGYHLALGLASFGAEVLAVARTESALELLRKEADNRNLAIRIQPLDVENSKQVEELIAAEAPFSILVNNAGTNRPKLALETEEDDFDYVMDLNVKASFFVAKAVANRLIQEKMGGSIINISSQMGHVSSPTRSVYSASKHAVEGFSKGMAWEWAPFGIRVNTLCPTFIETPLTKPMLQDKSFMQNVLGSIAFGRTGKPDELIGPVVFLASDASSLVTGSSLMVDGGWTAR